MRDETCRLDKFYAAQDDERRRSAARVRDERAIDELLAKSPKLSDKAVANAVVEKKLVDVVRRANAIRAATLIPGDMDHEQFTQLQTMVVALDFACDHLRNQDKLHGLLLEREQQAHQATRMRLGALEDDLASRTAALRKVDEKHIEERVAREVAAARERERDLVAAEAAKLRSDLATSRAEVEELRASKKKLREALERARQTR